MNNMSNEVDYRLAKMLFADMCGKGVIKEKKNQEAVRQAMIERYAPPLGFLEQDISPVMSNTDFMELTASKLICGKCGHSYGRRPWHSTTYNDIVYDCRSRDIRKGFCGNSHIYEETLPDIAISIAAALIKQRHIAEQFIVKTYSAFDSKSLTEVHKYLGLIISEGSVNLSDGRDELHFIISDLVVNDRTLEIRLIDGTSEECELPEYTPRRKKK